MRMKGKKKKKKKKREQWVHYERECVVLQEHVRLWIGLFPREKHASLVARIQSWRLEYLRMAQGPGIYLHEYPRICWFIIVSS